MLKWSSRKCGMGQKSSFFVDLSFRSEERKKRQAAGMTERKSQSAMASSCEHVRLGGYRTLYSRASMSTASPGCNEHKKNQQFLPTSRSILELAYVVWRQDDAHMLAMLFSRTSARTCFAARSYLGGFMLPNFSMALRSPRNPSMRSRGVSRCWLASACKIPILWLRVRC